MKSIDEAGVEWHLLHPEADKEETWKAGANYVLDTITECLPKTMSCNPNEVIDIIVSRIKELKK